MTDSTLEPDDVGRALAGWLPQQRWFGAKGHPITDVSVRSDVVVGSDDELDVHHLVLDVTTDEGTAAYQVLLGLRDLLPARLEPAVVGPVAGRMAYDALHDPAATALLLVAMAGDRDIGPLRFRSEHVEGGPALDPEAPSRLLGAEQSNTSLVFGDELVCKVFRRLHAGTNPDLEVTRALTQAGSPHVAAVRGWVEGDVPGGPAGGVVTLAQLQTFLRTGSEGWSLATASVRDLFLEADLHAEEVGGDFASEAERLGTATAAVHRTLAEVLPTGTADDQALRATVLGMTRRLDAAVTEVPGLQPFAAELRAVFEQLTEHAPVAVQRVHGDYHLGQVMRTETGWFLLDFEGEPMKRLSERTEPASVLRDVAGMLRSFDYVAHHLLADLPGDTQLAYRAVEWAERNRTAFCDGYAAEAGTDPRDDAQLLRALELDKAVYEVLYESRHRPAWLRIPLGAVERLVSETRA